MSDQFRIRVVSSADEVDQAGWDALAAPCETALKKGANPFLLHAFFKAVEDSKSACSRTGWLPQHLVLEDDDGHITGILPCYLKSHSQGEYVFDHGWADAFERAGGHYYPKLQCSVPFTPATGKRLLVAPGPGADTRRLALMQGLRQLCRRHDVSSAHITFMRDHEWRLAGESGFLLRTDQQFHWHNHDYADFDAFLETLSSRKRKNIRKERATALKDSGIEIDWLSGTEATEAVWDRFFAFYIDTGSRKWGRPYLTREFFSMIGETMPEQVVLIMARRNGDYIAGAINFVGDDCLFGRHWGCVEDHPCLHFEVCYYQAIDYAIHHGLARVEAGAQGAHKLARGYLPVTTHSAHWIENASLRRAVADYLAHERRHVEMENEALSAMAPFKKSGAAR